VHGRNKLGYPRRASIELDYARTWTLATDVRILARTPAVIVSQTGVH